MTGGVAAVPRAALAISVANPPHGEKGDFLKVTASLPAAR